MFKWFKKEFGDKKETKKITSYKPNPKSFKSFSYLGQEFVIFYTQVWLTMYHCSDVGLYISGFSPMEAERLSPREREKYFERTISESDLEKFIDRIIQFILAPQIDTVQRLGNVFLGDEEPRKAEFFIGFNGLLIVVFDSDTKSYLTVRRVTPLETVNIVRSRAITLNPSLL